MLTDVNYCQFVSLSKISYTSKLPEEASDSHTANLLVIMCEVKYNRHWLRHERLSCNKSICALQPLLVSFTKFKMSYERGDYQHLSVE